jgi:hypothetical protein
MPKLSLEQAFVVEKRADSILLIPQDPDPAALLNALRLAKDLSEEPPQRGAGPLREHHVLIDLKEQKTLSPNHLRPIMELQQALLPMQKKVILFGGNALQLKATLRTAGMDRAIPYFAKAPEALEFLGLADTPLEQAESSPEEDDLVKLAEVVQPFVTAMCEVISRTLSCETTSGEAFAKQLTGRSLLSVVGIRTPIEWEGFSGEYTLSLPRKTLAKLAELRGITLTDYEDAKNLETLIGAIASTAFVSGRDAMKKAGIKLLKAPVLSLLTASKYSLYDERVIPRVIRPFSTPHGDFFIEIYNRAASGGVFPG